MVILLEDGFDDATFDAWTATNGPPTIVESPVHHGDYSADFSGANANGIYVYKNTAAQSTVYFRGYFRLPSIPGSTYIPVIKIYASDYSSYCLACVTVNGKWALESHSGTTESDLTPGVDQWYCVEIMRTTGNGNGVNTLWINGSQIATRTTETQTVNASEFYAGHLLNTDVTVYGDCFVISDVAIGQEPGIQLFTLINEMGY